MQRGSAQLFLIIALVLILVVGGGYFYLNSKGKTPSPILKIIPKEITQSENFTNQTLGFGFTYPKDLTIKVDSEEEFNKRGNGNFRKNFTGYVGYEPPPFIGAAVVLDETSSYDNNPFTVWVFDNNNNLTIEQWFDDYWYYPFIWGVFDYTSKGHIAPEKEASISGGIAKSKIVSYQPGQPKYIYLAKDNKMYLFRVVDDANNIGGQILSSFKFISAEENCDALKGQQDSRDFVKGEILVGFQDDVSFDEAQAIISDLGLTIKDNRAFENLKILGVKVAEGEELKWICVLKNNPKVKYAEINQKIQIPDCRKGPC